jgi:hypothetical protein
MTGSSFSGYLRSDFDRFLTSPLWLDRNESPLSVMSALARLDIDPWQEAAALAALSKAAAVTRLSALLGPLPGAPPAKPDREGLCQRALGLLPEQHAVTLLQVPGVPAASKTIALARQKASSAMFLGWIVIAGLIGASVLPRLIDRPTAPAAASMTHASPAFTIDGVTKPKD